MSAPFPLPCVTCGHPSNHDPGVGGCSDCAVCHGWPMEQQNAFEQGVESGLVDRTGLVPAEPPTPSATEVFTDAALESLAIAHGWLSPCTYVGIGPCMRSLDHPLPHVTDPSKIDTTSPEGTTQP